MLRHAVRTPQFSSLRRTLSTALLLAVVGGGCASDDPADPMNPDPEPEVDTTAPSISATVPAAGEAGVIADTAIVVTFSEPMDAASVEAAYSSEDLPPESVAFSWNAAATELTIAPAAPFEYAAGVGTDPSVVEAKTYAVTIGTGAMDEAGNPLAAPLALEFATKRRMLASFPYDNNMTRVLRNTTLLSAANQMWVGDNSQTETYRSYLTFDLATLPAGAEVEAAEFSGTQTAPSGTPYTLGGVMADHVVYPAMIDAGTAPALSTPGAFSADTSLSVRRLTVTAEVQDDVANRAARNHRSQFRLRFGTATDGDNVTDTAVFTKSSFSMLVMYLAD